MCRLLLVSLIILLTTSGMPMFAANIAFYPVPDAISECPYAVKIDGKNAPIEKAGAYQGAYYVHFETGEKVTVTVNVKATAATIFTLKPERARVNLSASGQSGIKFDIDKPGTLVITCVCGSKELWPLIIFAEKNGTSAALSEEKRKNKIYYVKKYLSGDGMQTANIQKALDDCESGGGGVVYFEPGIYKTGALNIKSKTHVYLAPGCLIQGSSEPQDYMMDFGRENVKSTSPSANNNALINIINAKDCKISGMGVVDGAGHILRNEKNWHARLFYAYKSENITINGIVLRNPASWTVQLFGCKKINIDGLKIVTDWAVGNSDGINPDCTQDVVVTDYFGYTGDDAFAIKTTGTAADDQGSKNIIVRDCLVMTRKTAFKIGTETHKDVMNVLIENCEAVNSARGLGIYMRDGAKVSNITYRGLNFDLVQYPGESSSGMPYTILVEKRGGVGQVKDIIYERISSAAPYTSIVLGRADSKVENVTFRNCAFEVRNRFIKMDEKVPVLDASFCKNLKIIDCSLFWNTPLETTVWNGFLRQENCEGVCVEGLTEKRNTK